jgi:hypothetical protein
MVRDPDRRGLLWFADRPVDVAVFEVGPRGSMGCHQRGRCRVAVVTNVGLDHVEFLGPTRADVAGEKAGIVKPAARWCSASATRSCGRSSSERPRKPCGGRPRLRLRAQPPRGGGRVARPAHPGRRPTKGVAGPARQPPGRQLCRCPGRGRGLLRVEPLDDRLVREAAATVRSPGRLEIVGHEPLVCSTGPRTSKGRHRAAAAVAEEFGRPARSADSGGGHAAGKDPPDARGPRRRRPPGRRVPPSVASGPPGDGRRRRGRLARGVDSQATDSVARSARSGLAEAANPTTSSWYRARYTWSARPAPALAVKRANCRASAGPLPCSARESHPCHLQTRRRRAGPFGRDHRPPRTQRPASGGCRTAHPRPGYSRPPLRRARG